MIRRNAVADDGSPRWVLISQVQHARLSGELARHWGSGDVRPPQPAEVVVPTIFRHDDGWQAWETHPRVDPQTGRPLAFTEMPHAVADEIWSHSVATVAELGPLAQYMVASHFLQLRSRGSEPGEPPDPFVVEFTPRAARWLAEWRLRCPSTNADEVAHTALAHLQLFDALSLWFCCAALSRPQSFPSPGGPEVTFHPRSADRVEVHPWPWSVPRLSIQATGRSVAARYYASSSDLAEAKSETVALRWELVPAPCSSGGI